ncbi:Transcriptional activator protein acu-15 [Lachnellula arida]|uniref:Transcriptional activator protein acu-15 n=1 Tax=Lachnellula arida TaxID=1316785 RepID=A0A8T9BED2_9HELO|nr:Transcriptional activator protein acu-15 [Lachnellula arida]
MPGILPMKVIKVGSSAQSRIAQACDRCRSKKIRCDGVRPCCSQCSNVGFECKTSDKLSRRAFPRGYTESLEDRVRTLEGEVRELKDLLDEKDEKIDMLSKMHSNQRPSMSPGTPPVDARKEAAALPPKEDVFRVQASPLLLGAENSDSYFMGASSGRAFVDAFKRRIQESGKSLAGFNTEAFLAIQRDTPSLSPTPTPKTSTTPPRIFSDRCVNVFFQEWAPLFPVLHKPTFLRLYEEYMSNPQQIVDSHKLAQLHLVFGIASISSDIPDREHIALCEFQWRLSLEAVLMENSLATLQCLILALIYCISKADYTRLQHYKAIAVGLSHRLGLHQSQKRFSFGALTIETRKKVFWTLYTIDCFSAALLGLPKLLKEEDYVTEKGFQPTLPGEYTKISSALALFRASRILSKVLEQNYPAAAAHDLSLQSFTTLEKELNEWSENLPTHLKLTFVQDKPSTDITGSRSALLSLAFYYIRSLIHRPAVGSTLGSKSSPSVISLAESSKHIIQIIQLLEERSMSFSFCVNKNEMLTLCGLSLLYQGLDLKQEGKLMQDGQRLVAVVIGYLEKADAPGASDFKKLAVSLENLESRTKTVPARSPSIMPAPKSTKSTPSPSVSKQPLRPQMYRHGSASTSETDLLSQQDKLRRATLPNIGVNRLDGYYHHDRASRDSDFSERPMPKRGSVPQLPAVLKRTVKNDKPPNLNYLSLNNTPVSSQPQSPVQSRAQNPPHMSHNPVFSNSYSSPALNTNTKTSTPTPTEWEVLLGSLDGGQSNLYDAIYGGPALSLTDPTTSNYGDWSPDSGWDMTSMTMNDFSGAPGPARSVLSLSEESLSSGEDLSTSDLGMGSTQQDFRHTMMSGSVSNGESYLLENLEGTFGL